uniref:Uncharacterized protein n=1 Tax=Lactuca sativa TaxID=4236 RepID=A0A9R1XM29_LACSA|nr:hypothetical protein LSAT_V11C300151730 [Lactuca sativa]
MVLKIQRKTASPTKRIHAPLTKATMGEVHFKYHIITTTVQSEIDLGWICSETQVWWLMTQRFRSRLGCGFGETIRAINGDDECIGRNGEQVNLHVGYYTEYRKQFGIPTGPNLRC